MNEKIRELAKLARLDADQIMCEILCYDYDDIHEKNLNDAWVAIPIETRYEVTEIIEQIQEKFAELILGECVRVCNKQTPNWKGEYATAFGDGIEFCISGIKDHFGIEDK